ncbi:hypothetical protein MSAN_01802200 [Mycena sanguinolenta]|uniref:Uncharacterized protein n=1 Tax=Mycena sanguinolenta TaxID=230812 RepID=A0A8H7CSI7_9AGAR|nr:hypothetical protein MSAN_01802200 [Mycena sanguinolenta]
MDHCSRGTGSEGITQIPHCARMYTKVRQPVRNEYLPPTEHVDSSKWHPLMAVAKYYKVLAQNNIVLQSSCAKPYSAPEFSRRAI